MKNRNVNLVFLTCVFITMCLSPCTYCWWTEPWATATHDDLAYDAIYGTDAGVPFIDELEYPDIHRFANKIRYGANYEAHNPPGIPGEEHRWDPPAKDWFYFDDSEATQHRPDVLDEYEDNQFLNAYLKIGYMCHLYQDTYVPAHQYYVIHGMIIDGEEFDEFEEMAYTTHGYADGNAPWTWEDTQSGETWPYWLKDESDDDNDDGNADGILGSRN